MNKNGVFRWNLINKRLVKSYRPHAALTEASFSFDGKRIVTGSRSVKIWDAVTGNAIGKIDSPHVGPVRTVQFAPRAAGETNYLFATGGDDQVVRVWSWDDQANEVKQQLEFKLDAVVRRIRFAADAKALLIVGDQGLVQVQSLDVGVQPILFKAAKAGDISSCAFSADGKVVAVGGSDYRVRLWIVPQPGEQAGAPIVLSGHADVINDLTLIGASLQDLRVLTASADDTARLWDPRFNSKSGLGREMLSLRRHQGDVMAVDATENGDLVMTAGRDGMVILWPAE
jgi:WD40 repeat protein